MWMWVGCGSDVDVTFREEGGLGEWVVVGDRVAGRSDDNKEVVVAGCWGRDDQGIKIVDRGSV